MLKLVNVYTSYGNIEAMKGVSVELSHGKIVAIIGSNGAGKSTMLNTISGVLHPKKGTIEFLGKRIEKLPAYTIVEMGISQVPEGRRIFPQLTVRENLEMGAYIRTGVRDQKNHYRRYGRGVCIFSNLKRTAKADWRNFERRRAANAGHCTGLDGKAETTFTG